MRMRDALFGAAVLATALAWVPEAGARDSDRSFGYQGWGPRVGLSFDPDQVVVGAHVDMGDLIARRLRFQPSAEIGFGDDVTSFQVDGAFWFHFNTNWEAWRPYAGGAIGFVGYSVDGGEDSSDLGLSVGGGIEKNLGANSFFIEGRIGIEDTPDFKAMVGWLF